MEDLKLELKNHLIAQLNLEDMEASDIENDTPLFGDDGLGLDSIDALEIIVLLESKYKMKLENPEEGKTIFHSINSLAAFISSKNQ